MGPRCAIRKAELTAMNKPSSGREEYVRLVLDAYRTTPGTCGHLRRPDRLLAIELYRRGVPLGEDRKCSGTCRGSPHDPACRRPTARRRALAGLLRACHRRSTGNESL